MRAQDFFEELGIANHCLEKSYDRFLGEYGLSHARWLVIDAVIANGDKARPTIIASKLGLTKATVSSLVKSLEMQGLVGRRPCVKDGRQICVFISSKGKSLAEEIRPSLEKYTHELFDNVAKDKLVVAYQVFKQIQNNQSQKISFL